MRSRSAVSAYRSSTSMDGLTCVSESITRKPCLIAIPRVSGIIPRPSRRGPPGVGSRTSIPLKENVMELLRVKATWYLGAALIAITAVLAGSAVRLGAQQAASAVPIDSDDIGGVVTGPNGPEA